MVRPHTFTYKPLLLWTALLFPIAAQGAFDYSDAVTKSLLYFEVQRSGRLPYNQRVTWRGHSGLTDGLEQGVRRFFFFFSVIFLTVNLFLYLVFSPPYVVNAAGGFGWRVL